MNKSEFLNSLEEKLKELPKDEIRKTIDYYDEMIDDRIEDGMTEEEAVKSIGNSGDIALSILLDHEASIPGGTGKGFRDEDRYDDDDDRVESKKREYREKTEYEGGPDNSTEQYYADPKFSEERIREYREAYGDDLYADEWIKSIFTYTSFTIYPCGGRSFLWTLRRSMRTYIRASCRFRSNNFCSGCIRTCGNILSCN